MITTLYKRGSSGKIQVWSIEVEGSQYRSISGFEDGAMTTSEWTIATAKNIGKSNEVRPEVQAILEAEAKMVKKMEDGYTKEKESVDNALAAAFIEPMLAYAIEKKPKAVKPGSVVIVQPKLDGMRCIITKDGMFSRNGKPILSCPHILADGLSALKKLPYGCRLDGELYNHNFKDDFNSLISLVKKGKPLEYEDIVKIQYHIYDIDATNVVLDDLSKSFYYPQRMATIERIIDKGLRPSLCQVPSVVIELKGWDDPILQGIQGGYLEQGYEGAMVRIIDRVYETKRSDSLLKVKTFIDGEFPIVEILEGQGNRSNMAGKITILLPDGKTCEAGIAGGVAYYKELWANRENLIGKLATVKYFGYTPDGKLRFPVTKMVDRQDL